MEIARRVDQPNRWPGLNEFSRDKDIQELGPQGFLDSDRDAQILAYVEASRAAMDSEPFRRSDRMKLLNGHWVLIHI